MVWGISSADLKIYGWNTAVTCGVALGCAVAAYGVKKLAEYAFANTKPNAPTADKEHHAKLSRNVGLLVGIGATAAAYKFVPASRFALVTDELTNTMWKLGALQAIVGFILDKSVGNKFPAFAVLGAGGAAATRFGTVVLIGAGALGAALGSGIFRR